MTADVITAILTPISLCVLAYITYLTNRQLKKNHAKTEEVLVVASQVDRAVNGKAPGEASLSQDVTTIKDKQEFDNPTVVADTGNGRAVIPLIERLTARVEELANKLNTSSSKEEGNA